jgi:hypothetical protein
MHHTSLTKIWGQNHKINVTYHRAVLYHIADVLHHHSQDLWAVWQPDAATSDFLGAGVGQRSHRRFLINL